MALAERSGDGSLLPITRLVFSRAQNSADLKQVIGKHGLFAKYPTEG